MLSASQTLLNKRAFGVHSDACDAFALTDVVLVQRRVLILLLVIVLSIGPIAVIRVIPRHASDTIHDQIPACLIAKIQVRLDLPCKCTEV